MKIRKAHLKRLLISKALRGKKASAFKMFVRSWKFYLALNCIVGLAFYFYMTSGYTNYGIFLVGVLSGVVLRDITWIRSSTQFWPVSEAVTDWAKVDQLIEEDSW